MPDIQFWDDKLAEEVQMIRGMLASCSDLFFEDNTPNNDVPIDDDCGSNFDKMFRDANRTKRCYQTQINLLPDSDTSKTEWIGCLAALCEELTSLESDWAILSADSISRNSTRGDSKRPVPTRPRDSAGSSVNVEATNIRLSANDESPARLVATTASPADASLEPRQAPKSPKKPKRSRATKKEKATNDQKRKHPSVEMDVPPNQRLSSGGNSNNGNSTVAEEEVEAFKPISKPQDEDDATADASLKSVEGAGERQRPVFRRSESRLDRKAIEITLSAALMNRFRHAMVATRR